MERHEMLAIAKRVVMEICKKYPELKREVKILLGFEQMKKEASMTDQDLEGCHETIAELFNNYM